jgi:hypothetical protein
MPAECDVRHTSPIFCGRCGTIAGLACGARGHSRMLLPGRSPLGSSAAFAVSKPGRSQVLCPFAPDTFVELAGR